MSQITSRRHRWRRLPYSTAQGARRTTLWRNICERSMEGLHHSNTERRFWRTLSTIGHSQYRGRYGRKRAGERKHSCPAKSPGGWLKSSAPWRRHRSRRTTCQPCTAMTPEARAHGRRALRRSCWRPFGSREATSVVLTFVTKARSVAMGFCRLRFWHWVAGVSKEGEPTAVRAHGLQLQPRWDGRSCMPIHNVPPFRGAPALEISHPLHKDDSRCLSRATLQP